MDTMFKTLDRFAPWKKKYSRGNNVSFMYKSLSSVHMRRSGLVIAILKKRSKQNRLSYVKQGNSCVSHLRKSKRDYYANLMKKNLPIINSFGEQ